MHKHAILNSTWKSKYQGILVVRALREIQKGEKKYAPTKITQKTKGKNQSSSLAMVAVASSSVSSSVKREAMVMCFHSSDLLHVTRFNRQSWGLIVFSKLYGKVCILLPICSILCLRCYPLYILYVITYPETCTFIMGLFLIWAFY